MSRKKTEYMPADPCLYIIMRGDMESMNAGKAMAQASHASNAMVYKAIHDPHVTPSARETFLAWQEATNQGFGTAIVLTTEVEDTEWAIEDAERFLVDAIENVQAREGDDLPILAGIVTDPTYPIRDGKIMHFLNVKTCAYVLIDKGNLTAKARFERNFGFLPLHP